MLNFFNFRKDKNGVFITNDFGEYSRLSYRDFADFVQHRPIANIEKESELIEKGFIINEDVENFIRSRAEDMKYMKSYVFKSPSLHIFVVTTECNGNCVYCQAHSSVSEQPLSMSKEIAERAVDIALTSPQNYLSFEFQGGEPLLNFDTIRHIIEYTERVKEDKIVEFNLVSNLVFLTDEMTEFLRLHNVSVSTSLDGNKAIHDINRPMKNASVSMYDCTMHKVKWLKEMGVNIGAIETTTRYSLGLYKEIVDEYVCNGFQNIFIRPLTPLGMAHDNWNEIGYTADEFNLFYKSVLNYLLEMNRSGYYISEGHANIFLRKILGHEAVNYMELRSPCGGGIGQIAYYPNGDIYTCDEGRMLAEIGDRSFRMGNVFADDYNTLINSTACKVVCKSSILEALPSCSQCVYQPYCGVCPVINYAYNKTPAEKHPAEYRCKIYKGMLDTIFDMLKSKDAEEIFLTWIN